MPAGDRLSTLNGSLCGPPASRRRCDPARYPASRVLRLEREGIRRQCDANLDAFHLADRASHKIVRLYVTVRQGQPADLAIIRIRRRGRHRTNFGRQGLLGLEYIAFPRPRPPAREADRPSRAGCHTLFGRYTRRRARRERRRSTCANRRRAPTDAPGASARAAFLSAPSTAHRSQQPTRGPGSGQSESASTAQREFSYAPGPCKKIAGAKFAATRTLVGGRGLDAVDDHDVDRRARNIWLTVTLWMRDMA